MELRLSEIIAPYVEAVQSLDDEIKQMEDKVEAAENELNLVKTRLKALRKEHPPPSDDRRAQIDLNDLKQTQLQLRDKVFSLNEIWRVAVSHRDRLKMDIRQSKKCIKDIARDFARHDPGFVQSFAIRQKHEYEALLKIKSLKQEAEQRTFSVQFAMAALKSSVPESIPNADPKTNDYQIHDSISKLAGCTENANDGVCHTDLHVKIMDLMQGEYSTLGRAVPEAKNLAVVVDQYWIEKRGRFQVKSWPMDDGQSRAADGANRSN